MHITLLFLVLPTWSLIANWFADSGSADICAVNKSWFLLSKITTPNTFHFLTSAFYPVMRKWGKLWAGMTRVPEPLCEKFGYSSCHLSNWTKSYPFHTDSYPTWGFMCLCYDLSWALKSSCQYFSLVVEMYLDISTFVFFLMGPILKRWIFFTDPCWFITQFFSLPIFPIAFNRNWISLNVAFLSI